MKINRLLRNPKGYIGIVEGLLMLALFMACSVMLLSAVVPREEGANYYQLEETVQDEDIEVVDAGQIVNK